MLRRLESVVIDPFSHILIKSLINLSWQQRDEITCMKYLQSSLFNSLQRIGPSRPLFNLFLVLSNNTIVPGLGGSPGLVVMGVDSRSKGRGFESQRRILDGHFFTLICCKNCIVCLKRPKINEKEAGVGPIFKKQYNCKHINYKSSLRAGIRTQLSPITSRPRLPH